MLYLISDELSSSPFIFIKQVLSVSIQHLPAGGNEVAGWNEGMASTRKSSNNVASTKRHSGGNRKYVASVDFGTNSVRCYLYDLQGNIRSQAAERVRDIIQFASPSPSHGLLLFTLPCLFKQITQLYPHQGWNEIDPEEAWAKFQTAFQSALNSGFIS